MAYRAKLALIVVGTIVLLFAADTAYEGFKTLRQLDLVEAERDQWQRSSEIVSALELKRGDSVVDLGCGSGYFALKLSSVVGPDGKVYAVDIRRLSLVFLMARSIRKGRHNITTVLGEPDDPQLPSSANAVLIANTYHELEHPDTILDKVYQSLAAGGRLVVADPEKTEHRNLSAMLVEAQLRQHGFDIVKREDKFIDKADTGAWWLIVARRP